MISKSTTRQRTTHVKSRQGCQTCKARHVKCDEVRPICDQCSKKKRPCVWTAPVGDLSKRTVFTNVTFQPTLSKAFELTEPAVMALDYFRHVTLPSMQTVEPSLLWSYIAAHVHSDQSLCFVAAALGSFHRASTSDIDTTDGETLQLQALRSLGMDKQLGDADAFKILTCCLLLAMIQQFRVSDTDFETHLKHGLLMSNAIETSSTELDECKRFLKQAMMSTVLSNSLSRNENDLISLIGKQAVQTAGDKDTSISLQDRVSRLALQLLGTFELTVELLYSDLRDVQRQQVQHSKILELEQEYDVLQSEIGRASTLGTSPSSERGGILLASCLLLGVFMRCAAQGNHCAYDDELSTFKNIVNMLDKTLPRHMLQRPLQAATPIIAHGGIYILFYTTLLCRHSRVRRQAMELLRRCPAQDGHWTAESTLKISQMIIDFEEEMATSAGYFSLNGHIPESCRVHFFRTITRADESTVLRIYRRSQLDDNAYIQDDLPFG